jgi:dihydrofolate synthase/folylpolyglutamate synthase
MADKAVGEVLATLSGQIDGWYLGELPGSRAMPMAALAELIALYSDAPAERHANAGDALSAALSAAAPGDRVLVFGSFVTVAEARRALV